MISIKTPAEIKILRKGGRHLAGILNALTKMVKPGVGTMDLENYALKLFSQVGGRPAFKNYKMYHGKFFPSALCVSINEEIVHGPATPNRILNAGDIVSIDIGMEYPLERSQGQPINKQSKNGGYYTDMSTTVAVGEISKEIKDLLKTTKECLDLAIDKVKPGNFMNDIGASIQQHAEKKGYGVVRELVGHGVGHDVHEEPQVPNYVIEEKGYTDIELKPGMVIAIEPMVTMGSWRIKTTRGGCALSTIDGSLSAHYEHTVAVTDYGHLVITAL